jgi:hypothetical protein
VCQCLSEWYGEWATTANRLFRLGPMPFFEGRAMTAMMMIATKTTAPITHSQTHSPLSRINRGSGA